MLKDISISYGNYGVIHNVSLDIGPQEIVTILGPNGAGKTSLLLTISGLIHPISGKIIFQGREIQGLTPDKILRSGIAQCPEGKKLFSRLSVLDNLKMGAFSRKDKADINKTFDEVYNLFPILHERRKQLAGTMSGGEQQRLAMARALINNPELLFADEPTSNIDADSARKALEILAGLRSKGCTIVVATHDADLFHQFEADAVYCLANGMIEPG